MMKHQVMYNSKRVASVQEKCLVQKQRQKNSRYLLIVGYNTVPLKRGFAKKLVVTVNRSLGAKPVIKNLTARKQV